MASLFNCAIKIIIMLFNKMFKLEGRYLKFQLLRTDGLSLYDRRFLSQIILILPQNVFHTF